jgi:mono/diheme cytochrome c family protein
MAREGPRGGAFFEVGIWLLFFALLVPAALTGWAIGHSSRAKAVATTTAPPGHQGGANLSVSAIGDPVKGQAVFDAKHCSDCHSYNGHGGTDAPPLDSMRGHLSATEIAAMSGTIWNHLPTMLPHFKEEGIPLPTFTGSQMADLIAYLHGGPAKGTTQTTTAAITTSTMNMSTMTAMAGNAAMGKQLFAAQGCGSCHTFAAASSSGTVGPNLDTALRPDAERAHKTLQVFVRESIVKPNADIASGFQPGVMPQSYGQALSNSQVSDLVAFLARKGG